MKFLLQLWDARKKGCQQTFQSTYQVTAVSFNDTAEQVISGGIDNDIKVSHRVRFASLTNTNVHKFVQKFLSQTFKKKKEIEPTKIDMYLKKTPSSFFWFPILTFE